MSRKREIGFVPDAPRTIICESFGRVVPPVDEVVMSVDDCRSTQFQIRVVILERATVSGNDNRMWIEIDPTDKRNFRICSGVDQPNFLMLTEASACTIPPNFDTGLALIEQGDVVR